MDLFILSSQAEAFPNVLAEAMATGLPCITTDAGDARNIVEDTELVVPIGDYVKLSSIADKIINLKDSERLQIGNKLLCRVRENYSIQAMVKSYEGAYINNVKGLKCQKNF
jgi:glycosyltransferase involved in cell wall biosynthesis